MVKPPLRTKSIGFKVSEEEYAQLETAAGAGPPFASVPMRPLPHLRAMIVDCASGCGAE